MWNRLYPISGENVLTPKYAALIASFMANYELDVAQLISREIYDWVVKTDIIMAFPYLLMPI